MASRPLKKLSRLRQTESTVYAPATRSGSRVFHASSAAWTFLIAASRSNGGSGGRSVIAFSLMTNTHQRPLLAPDAKIHTTVVMLSHGSAPDGTTHAQLCGSWRRTAFVGR